MNSLVIEGALTGSINECLEAINNNGDLLYDKTNDGNKQLLTSVGDVQVRFRFTATEIAPVRYFT